MLDGRIRPWIDRTTAPLAGILVRFGVSADMLTFAGCGLGLTGAAVIAAGFAGVGLVLFLAGRVLDGLDGAVARQSRVTDRGGFLDIALDFVVYAAMPLAFAIENPGQNALPAAALLAGFLLNGSAFLAFAALAAKRGREATAQGAKSIYYLAGLAEGAETIAAFTCACLWPAWFPVIAWGFAALCAISGGARMVVGWRAFR